MAAGLRWQASWDRGAASRFSFPSLLPVRLPGWFMDSKPPRLLIVEDDPNLAMGLRDNFELEGCSVLSAADGEEAVRQAISGQPDLILLDIMLPKMSGLDVCQT